MSASPAVRPSLLVLTSTFPKSVNDSTPPFVFQLCSHLLPHFDVTVLTPAVRDAPQTETLQGVKVQRFHYFWPRSLERLADGAILESLSRSPWLFLQVPFLVLFELITAFRLARTSRPDVIHAHWFVPQGIVAVLVSRILNIPAVITAHGGDVYGLRGRLLDALRRALASRCEAVTVVSRDMAAKLPEVTSCRGEPPSVMPMGVDTRRFSGESERGDNSDQTVLFVGRLAKKKGVEYLLRAFPDVLACHPDARLVVVGDGPCRGELEALSSQLGLAQRVRFAGAQPPAELPRFYSRSRVFVGPSVVTRGGDTESFGLVFVEAMAADCPVVGTSVGGIPDVVIHGRTGLLVEPESPAALAAAISGLLDSPAEADRMGSLARRWVRRKFDWRQVARGYANLLARAAGVTE
ncbi:MAG: glycosyltransferase [Dehalococcoidia bacterium]|nr:MAG: glycosyltransferase [Dehalococcoidia bacterium]